MNDPTADIGVIEVLLERLEKQRLPRLLAIKERVDAGTPLDDVDIEFLESSLKDGRKIIPLLDRHPEYQELSAKVMSLYKEIMDKAMQIETNSRV